MNTARLLTLLAGLLMCLLALARDEPAAEGDEAAPQVLVMLQQPPPHYRPDGAYAGGYSGGNGSLARHRLADELARAHGLRVVTQWPMPAVGLDCFVLAVPAPATPEQVADELSRDARVAWAQPMHLYRGQQGTANLAPHAALQHDDPLYTAQPAAAAWRLAELHELATGRQVRVAVVDSAVDTTHPDLVGQVVQSENFVDGHASAAERHGTAVAGIIAALADNHVGMAGVAPQAQILSLRACWQARDGATLCNSLGLARALYAALSQKVAVINMSLGGPSDRLLALLLDTALQQGIAVVAAMDPTLPGGGFPASHAGVLAVADLPTAGALSAPGRDVMVPVPGARWALASGSSYASAHVAGLVALLRELKARGPVPGLVRDAAGGIDTCATLLHAAGPRRCACALPLDATAVTALQR
ncbi:S8 family serine peptidase [Ideonella azotifigens]|uniref:Peptidase S8/S53 domain-containing protein n=1 Tax=Ideonella azotifigens TaxID=513160 RepID=A0ABN1JR15_9BURK|nr:S8 family serine peptidase [Ideonella azotifigens]MCD2340169.1 S8 family serine peptidase [Ideonella azotifigens]